MVMTETGESPPYREFGDLPIRFGGHVWWVGMQNELIEIRLAGSATCGDDSSGGAGGRFCAASIGPVTEDGWSTAGAGDPAPSWVYASQEVRFQAEGWTIRRGWVNGGRSFFRIEGRTEITSSAPFVKERRSFSEASKSRVDANFWTVFAGRR